MGPSPSHGRQVSLILSPATGLVSPQYHVTHHDYFKTASESSGNLKTHSLWQRLAGLTVTRFDPHHRANIFHNRRLNDIIRDDQRSNDTGQNNVAKRDSEIVGQANDYEESDEHDHQVEQQDELGDPVNVEDEAEEQRMTYRSTSRYGRVRQMTQRMRQAIDSQALSSIFVLHEDTEIVTDRVDPVALLTTTNRDTMYFDQAMKEADAPNFIEAIITEMNDHINRKHWKLIPRSSVPQGHKVLPSVWSMKRKRDIMTNWVYKWKTRLNIHGGRQEYGVNYTETFSPVVNWLTVRMILTLSIIHK